VSTGVLLLHGSSGTPDLERARILEAEGTTYWRQRSAWTWQGEPLPFVPFDPEWRADDDPPSYTGWYRQSLKSYDANAELARIPVERIREVLLVAGGDDRVWPAVEFAAQIVAARGDQETRVVMLPEAGHRVVLPGEQPKNAGQRMARGGSAEADRALGALAWDDVRRVLAG
jgi:hypothetical protein